VQCEAQSIRYNRQLAANIGVALVRVKTEDRRQAIVDVAIEIFREVGYERATMAMISRRLGGSKGTLYGYFDSKEELFEAAMKAASEGAGDQIMGILKSQSGGIRAVLESFSLAYLNFILGKDVLAITRTAIADGAGSSLGPHLFEQGPGRAITKLAEFFEKEMALGRIRQTSPLTVAVHFKGLIEAGFLEEALYGATPEFEKRPAISKAVDTFLRAFGVPKTRKAAD
jgi:AcrR family transcriptional regulator